jgi:hypothetical protein
MPLQDMQFQSVALSHPEGVSSSEVEISASTDTISPRVFLRGEGENMNGIEVNEKLFSVTAEGQTFTLKIKCGPARLER